jgi:hypothetical protein
MENSQFIIPDSYENSGFLYINNNGENKTFIKGKIIDCDGKTICLGEIIPNVSKKDFLDCIKRKSITHYSPLDKGIKIRIYWFDNHFIISTENEIYPDIYPDINNDIKYKNQINCDLLDKKFCYYAILTEDKIILTYMLELKKRIKKYGEIPLLSIPHNLSEDLAFEHHLEIFECTEPLSILENNGFYGVKFYGTNGIVFDIAN